MVVRKCGGFSLVEVVLALGIVAVVMVTLMALLPIGMKSNQVSAEETRAVGILSILEADLRNTHPSLNGGRSLIFGLPLPYVLSGGRTVPNPSLQPKVASGNSVFLDETESPVAGAGPARYQATIIYAPPPATNSLNAIQARLIVNWPATDLQNFSGEAQRVAALTDPAKVSGFVEACVSFPHP